MGLNPCFCWNLKDGCVTVGIWTLVYSIIQLSIFSWQSYRIKYERDKSANRRLPFYGTMESYDNRYLGPDWTKFYVSPEERFFTVFQLLKDKAANERRLPMLGVWKPEGEKWKSGFELAWMTPDEQKYYSLFVIQILCLIGAFFLLFASVSLIYGIHTSSKHLIWPWFPCIAASILCSMAYCVTWWVWGVENYWLILTIIEAFSVIVNCYALMCVVVQYRRVLQGLDGYVEEQKVPVVVWDDQNQRGNAAETKWGPEAYWNKTFEEEPKRSSKRHLYAQGMSDFGAVPGKLKQGQEQQQSWPLSTPIHRTEQVLQQYQSEPKRSREEQRPKYLPPVNSEETIPVETVFQGPAEPSRPTKEPYLSKAEQRDLMERSRSVDALTAKLAEQQPRKSMRASKSKDSLSSRHRSHSRHKHESYSDDDTYDERSFGGSRARISDTDTGYSETSRRSRRRHRHHSCDDDDHSHHKHRRHRRVREVKREDKERSDKKPSTTPSPSMQPYPFGAAPMPSIGLPMYPPGYALPYSMAFAGSGELATGPAAPVSQLMSGYPVSQAFAHPSLLTPQQHAAYSPAGASGMQIVVPSTSGATQVVGAQRHPAASSQQQPQQVQINSEILISYNEQQASTSRPESRHSTSHMYNVQPSTNDSSSLMAVANSDTERRAPSASGSMDSKGTGATAV